jgi:ribosomal protein L37AE/L43A
MSMSGHEVHSCEECGASDYDCFMVKREKIWFCKECDPVGNILDPVDATEDKRDGGWR